MLFFPLINNTLQLLSNFCQKIHILMQLPSAQVQILLAVCRRSAMVKMSSSGSGYEKRRLSSSSHSISLFFVLIDFSYYYEQTANQCKILCHKTKFHITLVRNMSPQFSAQKLKFSIMDFLIKYDQIRRKLWLWSHLPKKSLMEKFIF